MKNKRSMNDFINFKSLKSDIEQCMFWRANTKNEPFEDHAKSMHRFGISIDAIAISYEIMKYNNWPVDLGLVKQ